MLEGRDRKIVLVSTQLLPNKLPKVAHSILYPDFSCWQCPVSPGVVAELDQHGVIQVPHCSHVCRQLDCVFSGGPRNQTL